MILGEKMRLTARRTAFAPFFLLPLFAAVFLVFAPCGTLRAADSHSWLTEEHLADVLLYHVLLDEEHYEEAGLVLRRLLANEGGGSYVLCLEAEYAFVMLTNKKPGDWLDRAGRATWWAIQMDETHWRVLYNRARWLELSDRRREALLVSMRAIEDSNAPDSVLF